MLLCTILYKSKKRNLGSYDGSAATPRQFTHTNEGPGYYSELACHNIPKH